MSKGQDSTAIERLEAAMLGLDLMRQQLAELHADLRRKTPVAPMKPAAGRIDRARALGLSLIPGGVAG